MTTKYLLACNCGNNISVDASQAGLMLRCACGAEVQAPTLRGLRQLPTMQAAPKARTGKWTPGHSLMLVGGLMIAIAGAGALLVRAMLPLYDPVFAYDSAALQQEIMDLTAAQTLEWWEALTIELSASPDVLNWRGFEAQQTRAWHWVRGLGALAAIGLLTMAGGWFKRGQLAQRR